MTGLHGWFRARRSPATDLLVAMCPCAVLVLIQWWPGLVRGETPVWGDAVPFGLPLLQLHAEALRGHASLLWSDAIYGGHPIFAEGQGGFAHPLNIVLALLVTPRWGAHYSGVLLHVVDLLCMAFGTALFARRLGLGIAATGFAALAVVFAPAILLQQNNIAIGGSLGFVPLSLWAFERCWDRPCARDAVLLAVVVSSLVLAGYPQTVHALLILLAGRVAVPAAGALLRRPRLRERNRLAPVLAGAAVLTLGLTAVQLLPLAQLAVLSHRAGGVALVGTLKWRFLLRSCAMGDLRPSAESLQDAFGIGSMLVCIPATLLLALRGSGVPTRIGGYALGTVLCLLAAIGDTPLFPLLHAGLLPGMRFFRITVIYAAVATIPVAVLAGFVLDRRAALRRRTAAGVVLVWVAVLVPLHPSLAPVAIGTALAGLAMLLWRPRAGALGMLLLLLFEIVVLRLHPFPFEPVGILSMPEKARAIRALAPDPLDRRSYGVSLSTLASLMLPHQPGEPAAIRREIETLIPMTGLDWAIPSMGGALALPSRRRMLAEPLLADALLPHGAPPGSRLADLLAVRFLVSDTPSDAEGLSPVGPAVGPGIVYRNRAALPFAQGFARHESVPDMDAAASRLAALRAPALVIEDPAHLAPPDAPDRAAPAVTVRENRQTLIRLAVRSDGPGWVVVTDSDFPGWTATLDGRPVPVFAAQLLAKAVPVPAGQHSLVLRYRSVPFEIGLAISLFSLGVAGLVLVRR